MVNPFGPNAMAMMQQMMGGMVQKSMGNMMQQTMGNMPPMMQMMMDPGQLEQKYRDFRAQYRGDPQADLDRMIREGRINQQMLPQLRMMAQMLPKV